MSTSYEDIAVQGNIEMVDEESGGWQRSSFRNRGLTFSPDAPENAPTVLAWKDLTVSVKQGANTKTLLDNISGTITGGFWAIMGASGGGKTTLLSTLSLRLDRWVLLKENISIEF